MRSRPKYVHQLATRQNPVASMVLKNSSRRVVLR